MIFYFYPSDESTFKKQAIDNYVHTLVFDTAKGKIITMFTRHVKKEWSQTCKNNIETDHRIKELHNNDYKIYSWITKSKNELNLPCFMKFS